MTWAVEDRVKIDQTMQLTPLIIKMSRLVQLHVPAFLVNLSTFGEF
jgi:hypothetical protein